MFKSIHLSREYDQCLQIDSIRGICHHTENHHPWIPGFPPPYLVAIVEFPEQRGLRLTTNLVDCDVDSVRIGMPLRVTFEEADDGIRDRRTRSSGTSPRSPTAASDCRRSG